MDNGSSVDSLPEETFKRLSLEKFSFDFLDNFLPRTDDNGTMKTFHSSPFFYNVLSNEDRGKKTKPKNI